MAISLSVLLALSSSISVSAASIESTENSSNVSTGYVDKLVSSIKANKCNNQDDINSLIKLYKNGNKEAQKQLNTFDCFNSNQIKQVRKTLRLAPNTSKKLTFADGSKAKFSNTSEPVNTSKLPNLNSMLDIHPESYTQPTMHRYTEDDYLKDSIILYHGGYAYSFDTTRYQVHIIDTGVICQGAFTTVTDTTSSIIYNDCESDLFKCTANVLVEQYGVVIEDGTYTDGIYLDTTGCMGFKYSTYD